MKQKELSFLKKGWEQSFPVLWVIILSLLFVSVPASAAEAETKVRQQKIQYDIYAGGFHVVKANMDLDMRKENKYRVFFDAVTRGFIAKLVKWEGSFESKGWFDKKSKSFIPEMHKSIAITPDETEVKEYYYKKDGTFSEFRVSDKYNDRTIHETDPALSDKTTDILSAAIQMMHITPSAGKCEGESEIFDGKRRFKLKFINEGTDVLKKSKYNIYEGEALKCVVKVEPKGGLWHEKPRGWMTVQEQGRAHGKLPTLWLASLSKGAPAIPVKMMVKSDYGAMVMHMTRYDDGQTVQLAQQQAE